jgi:hypothetical protein
MSSLTVVRSTAAQPSHAARQRRRGLRVTARGRRTVLLAVVLLLLGAFAVGRAANSQATGEPAAGPALTEVTVQQGDTLWQVARRVAPDRDPRELIAQIRRLNDMPTSDLQVGRQLVLPAVVQAAA